MDDAGGDCCCCTACCAASWSLLVSVLLPAPQLPQQLSTCSFITVRPDRVAAWDSNHHSRSHCSPVEDESALVLLLLLLLLSPS